ncbi:MAG: glycosyltransferase family 2 protein [Candidatus Baldrarchaeia archaeon]
MKDLVISVVIPAYNEEKTIEEVLSKTISVMESMGKPYEIIVVDDGSTDNTRQIVSKYKVTVLSNGANKGKGYALRKGFKYARGQIIVTLDSDGSHDPKEIPKLIDPLYNGVDIAVGSRFLGNGENSTTKLNRIGNKIINTIIMTLTRKYITDSQTGFRAFKREVIEKLHLSADGYEIETELTVKGLKNGFKYQEIPIDCRKRTHDYSKLRILQDGLKIVKTILEAKVRRL